jgi:hypothetical protein
MIAPVFCRPAEATNLTGLTRDELKSLRLSGKLQEGIHWVYINTRSIKFNVQLLNDWVATRHTPELHEIAIRNFLASLPSSQAPVEPRAKTSATRAKTRNAA